MPFRRHRYGAPKLLRDTRVDNRSPVWVPEGRRTSCNLLIPVNEAADAVPSFDLMDLGWSAVGSGRPGSSLSQGAVRLGDRHDDRYEVGPRHGAGLRPVRTDDQHARISGWFEGVV